MPEKIDREMKARATFGWRPPGQAPLVECCCGDSGHAAGVDKKSVRRWVPQAQTGGGQRASATSEEPAGVVRDCCTSR